MGNCISRMCSIGRKRTKQQEDDLEELLRQFDYEIENEFKKKLENEKYFLNSNIR